MNLVLVARSRHRLAEVAKALFREHNVFVETLVRDLYRPGAARSLFTTVDERGIKIGVLINNAAVLQNGQFSDTSLEDHLKLLQLNLIVPALTHLFLGPMLDRDHGRILNVASVAAFQPLARLSVYAAAKAYLLRI